MSDRSHAIVLVRHGETQWSREGRHTGRTDLALTDRGRAAARSLAGRLAQRRLQLVLVSPSRRARETCELCGLGAAAGTRTELLEWDYGEYEGLTTAEIQQRRPGWSLWRDGCPAGESAEDVGARADIVIGELRAAASEAAVFAHGHLLRVLAARWIGLPPCAGALLMLATASLSVLGYERATPALAHWNEAHALE